MYGMHRWPELQRKEKLQSQAFEGKHLVAELSASNSEIF